MEKEMIEKYLAACKLAGMETSRVQMVKTVLDGFAEYCEKQKKAKAQGDAHVPGRGKGQ